MFKRCKVVPLSTNQKSSISFVFNTAYKKILSFKDSFSDNITFGEYVHLYILSSDEIKEDDWILYNIHCSNRLNDFDAINDKAIITKYSKAVHPNIRYCKKIIATTDKSLKPSYSGKTPISKNWNGESLPQPSQSFIEKYITEYNKGNVITDVLVEYINWTDKPAEIHSTMGEGKWGKYNVGKLKINHKDNTITIKKVKDSWTREEVIEFAEKYARMVQEKPIQLNGYKRIHNHKWIEQNL